uniref:Uncharacterized protein n=1 Tax=Timema douglasi TaxID=61478 RepID=A0A7R8VFJ8_TIMDO|nr:unnamed protein product [Timema douglasi]
MGAKTLTIALDPQEISSVIVRELQQLSHHEKVHRCLVHPMNKGRGEKLGGEDSNMAIQQEIKVAEWQITPINYVKKKKCKFTEDVSKQFSLLKEPILNQMDNVRYEMWSSQLPQTYPITRTPTAVDPATDSILPATTNTPGRDNKLRDTEAAPTHVHNPRYPRPKNIGRKKRLFDQCPEIGVDNTGVIPEEGMSKVANGGPNKAELGGRQTRTPMSPVGPLHVPTKIFKSLAIQASFKYSLSYKKDMGTNKKKCQDMCTSRSCKKLWNPPSHCSQGMGTSSSSISSFPSSSLDSCCSLIISASSRVPQTVRSSSAAMYSSYVQSGDNLCHVSSMHG